MLYQISLQLNFDTLSQLRKVPPQSAFAITKAKATHDQAEERYVAYFLLLIISKKISFFHISFIILFS